MKTFYSIFFKIGIVIISLLARGSYAFASGSDPIATPYGFMQFQTDNAYIKCGLRDDNTVWCAGSNGGGSLGIGTTTQTSEYKQVQLPQNKIVKKLTASLGGMFAEMTDGTLYAWGSGPLGVSDSRTTPIPTEVNLQGEKIKKVYPQVFENYSMAVFALTESGNVYAWGPNTKGALGIGDTTKTYVNTPTKLNLGEKKAIEVYGNTSYYAGNQFYALMADGSVYAWGYNYNGVLGTGDTTNEVITSPMIVNLQGGKAKKIYMNTYYGNLQVYALMEDGSLWGWGMNGGGQNIGTLGVNDAINPIIANPKKLDLKGNTIQEVYTQDKSYFQTFALTTTGDLYAWGFDIYGGLGVGNSYYTRSLVTISPKIVDLKGKKIQSFYPAAPEHGGYGNQYALMTDGTVLAWGDNNDGILGVGKDSIGPDIVISKPTELDFEGKKIKKLYNYYNYSFAVSIDGFLYSWGYNISAILGNSKIGTTTMKPTVVPITNEKIKEVYHDDFINYGDGVYALTESGNMYAWGPNPSGKLGINDSSNDIIETPTIMSGLPNLNDALYINAPIYKKESGYGFMAGIHILMKDGTIYTWGMNDILSIGSLGVGNSTDSVQITPTLTRIDLNDASGMLYPLDLTVYRACLPAIKTIIGSGNIEVDFDIPHMEPKETTQISSQTIPVDHGDAIYIHDFYCDIYGVSKPIGSGSTQLVCDVGYQPSNWITSKTGVVDSGSIIDISGTGVVDSGSIIDISGTGVVDSGNTTNSGEITNTSTLSNTENIMSCVAIPIGTPELTSGTKYTIATPILSGNALPNSSISILIGDQEVCTSTTSETGKWSCILTTELKEGENTLSIQAKDPINSTTAKITPTITYSPIKPVIIANEDRITQEFGSTHEILVLINDIFSTEKADPSVVTLQIHTDNSEITIKNNNTIAFPASLSEGEHSIEYTICDKKYSNNCSTSHIYLTIVPKKEVSPEAVKPIISTPETSINPIPNNNISSTNAENSSGGGGTSSINIVTPVDTIIGNILNPMKSEEKTSISISPATQASSLNSTNITTEISSLGEGKVGKLYTLSSPLTPEICPNVLEVYTIDEILSKNQDTEFFSNISAMMRFRGTNALTESGSKDTFPEDDIKQGVVLNRDNFFPDHPVTRAEFIKMLVRSLACRYQENPETMKEIEKYSDMKNMKEWHTKYIAYATNKGWINGYENGTFRPNAYISRGEAAKILANAIKLPIEENTLSSAIEFNDVTNNSSFRKYIGALTMANVFHGKTKTYFGVNETISRGETSAIIGRTFLGEK